MGFPTEHAEGASRPVTSPPAAPWRSTFMAHVADMSPSIFTLSTLHAVPPQSASSPPPYVPRARTVVFRGMWGSLPTNSLNPAPRNPLVYESEMPVFTTDARMDKVVDLLGNEPASVGGSGGGGTVEGVFWAVKATTQWRLRGKAYVLGPDMDEEEAIPRRVRETLLGRMRSVLLSQREGEWSWSREVTAHFGNMSPVMRGSFRNPPPGSPVSKIPDDDRLGLGQKVTDLHDEVARKNFRVVVIVPEEVDQVDLSDARRWRYRFVPEGEAADPEGTLTGQWEVTELWP